MILASIWLATKTCQLHIWLAKSLATFFAQLLAAKSLVWQIVVANQARPKFCKVTCAMVIYVRSIPGDINKKPYLF